MLFVFSARLWIPACLSFGEPSTGWAVVWKLIVAILIGFALLTLSTRTDTSTRPVSLDWRSAVWLWPYLLGMSAISYLGSFDTRTPSSVPLLGLHGPRNELTFGWDVLAVALLSLAVYALAIRSRLPAERALQYVGDLTAEAEAESPKSPRTPDHPGLGFPVAIGERLIGRRVERLTAVPTDSRDPREASWLSREREPDSRHCRHPVPREPRDPR